MLDPVQQRVLGVLIEKERTVPESYPLTENALLVGCNQKNNRDPEMALEQDEILDALRRLQDAGWVTRVEQVGSRTMRWRHHFEAQLGIGAKETAVLAELLLRGPQAPGALKPRVQRLGLEGDPEEIRAVLGGLRDRPEPLVVQLPQWPRERDRRWVHTLGPRADVDAPAEPAAGPEPAAGTPLRERVARLEEEVAALREDLGRLRAELS